jgi:hypothetical protein
LSFFSRWLVSFSSLLLLACLRWFKAWTPFWCNFVTLIAYAAVFRRWPMGWGLSQKMLPIPPIPLIPAAPTLMIT